MNARSNRYYDKYDNCLVCQHSEILKNEVAKLIRRLGLVSIANKIDLMFPVVLCKLSDNKYIANPMTIPRWCKKQ